MQAVREWAESVIIACAVISAVSFIVPNGSIEKAFKILTALFLLLCFAAPVTKINGEIKEWNFTDGISEWIDDSKLQETVEKEIVDTLSAEIKAEISAYLESINISIYSIDVKVNIINSTDISIDKIIVEIPYGANFEMVSKYIKQQYEISPDFIFVGEGNK